LSFRRFENLMIGALWALDTVGLYLLAFVALSELPVVSQFFWPLFSIGVLGLAIAVLFFVWVSRIMLRLSLAGWLTTGSVRFGRLTSLALLALPIGILIINNVALLLGALSLRKSLVLDGVSAVLLFAWAFDAHKEFNRKPEDVWWTRRFQISILDLSRKLELLAIAKGFRIGVGVPYKKLPRAPLTLFSGEREVAEVRIRQAGQLLVRVRVGSSAEQLKSLFENAVRLDAGSKQP